MKEKLRVLQQKGLFYGVLGAALGAEISGAGYIFLNQTGRQLLTDLNSYRSKLSKH